MSAKVEDLERGYSATLIGCLVVGLLIIAFCLTIVTVFEIKGASRMALVIPEGPTILRSIVRLLVFGMLPTLGVAFLATAYTMQNIEKPFASRLAKASDYSHRLLRQISSNCSPERLVLARY